MGRKTKVLYIGHYREGTGWSQAAIDYILAADYVGIDIVCRAVKLNDSNPNLPDRILELEQKSIDGCTHVIQHILPHLMEYNGTFKNIGLYVTETDSIVDSGWPARLKLMDEVWVPNDDMLQTTIKAGITNPIRVVPHASDLDKFKTYDKLDIPNIKDTFVFYFIGEFSRRKHLSALLKAYHLEFNNNDSVSLIIKAHKPNVDSKQTFQEIAQTIEIVKQQLGLYPRLENYLGEIVTTNYMSEQQIMELHSTGDCFVMPSFGEAWNIPAFDALGMGNKVICSNVGGMKDFCQRMDGTYLVPGRMEPVFGADRIFGDMLTGRENWFNIDINQLRMAMRHAYDQGKEKIKRDLSWYSYDSIGTLMKNYINL